MNRLLLLVLLTSVVSICGMEKKEIEERVVFRATAFSDATDPDNLTITRSDASCLTDSSTREYWRKQPDAAAKFYQRLDAKVHLHTSDAEKRCWEFVENVGWSGYDEYKLLMETEWSNPGNQEHDIQLRYEAALCLQGYLNEIRAASKLVEIKLGDQSRTILRSTSDDFCERGVVEFWKTYEGPSTTEKKLFSWMDKTVKFDDNDGSVNKDKLWAFILSQCVVYQRLVTKNDPARFNQYGKIDSYFGGWLPVMTEEAQDELRKPSSSSGPVPKRRRTK